MSDNSPSDEALRAAGRLLLALGKDPGDPGARRNVGVLVQSAIDEALEDIRAEAPAEATTTDFQPGDVVTLASGGKWWTVAAVRGEADDLGQIADIIREEDGKFRADAARCVLLRKVEPESVTGVTQEFSHAPDSTTVSVCSSRVHALLVEGAQCLVTHIEAVYRGADMDYESRAKVDLLRQWLDAQPTGDKVEPVPPTSTSACGDDEWAECEVDRLQTFLRINFPDVKGQRGETAVSVALRLLSEYANARDAMDEETRRDLENLAKEWLTAWDCNVLNEPFEGMAGRLRRWLDGQPPAPAPRPEMDEEMATAVRVAVERRIHEIEDRDARRLANGVEITHMELLNDWLDAQRGA